MAKATRETKAANAEASEATEVPAVKPWSDTKLATKRGGLADAMRIAAQGLTDVAADPALNELSQEAIEQFEEAVDEFNRLREWFTA